MPGSVQDTKSTLTIMTVHEVAEYLRMSEAKVYRLVKERQIPVVRIGKSWRFRKDLLDDWLSKCAESSIDNDRVTGVAIKQPAIAGNSKD